MNSLKIIPTMPNTKREISRYSTVLGEVFIPPFWTLPQLIYILEY